MVAAIADVTMSFLSFLCSSIAEFLLVSQNFAPSLITSCCLSVLNQIFQVIRYGTERFHGDLVCF